MLRMQSAILYVSRGNYPLVGLKWLTQAQRDDLIQLFVLYSEVRDELDNLIHDQLWSEIQTIKDKYQ